MIYLTELADALKQWLTEQSLSVAATIARRRVLVEKLEALSGIQISVIPYGVNLAQTAYLTEEQTYDIRLVVQRVLSGSAPADETEADEAAHLVEELCRLLLGLTLVGVQCTSAAATPSYDPAKAHNLNLFDASIRTTWTTFEET